MERLSERIKMDIEKVVNIAITAVRVLHIVVTVIYSIRQKTTKDKHQKSNRRDMPPVK